MRAYVCMHACMHACMHVCMHACMHVCMYVCMHVCVYIAIYMYIHTRACVYLYMYMHICIDDVEVYLRCMILWLYQEFGSIILVSSQVPTVPTPPKVLFRGPSDRCYMVFGLSEKEVWGC